MEVLKGSSLLPEIAGDLVYQARFLSLQQREVVLKGLDLCEWIDIRHRRLLCFDDVDAFPNWIRGLLALVHPLFPEGYTLNHVLFNKYLPHQGIGTCNLCTV